MINGKKIVVVMPAYNAERTIRKTYDEIPLDVVDEVILVDDASRDNTAQVARELGIKTVIHPENRGYGGNQKTCYRTALEHDADIVVMVHPDYQYTPKLTQAMASMIAYGVYEAVLGSRVLGKGALAGGMPLHKYAANRVLTLAQNLCFGRKLSEYHTGYRAFSRKVLLELPLEENSDDFVFDNEMLVQLVYFGYEIAEITCPTLYFGEASSINLPRSIQYGIGVLDTTAKFLLHRAGIRRYPIFEESGRTLSLLPSTVSKKAL